MAAIGNTTSREEQIHGIDTTPTLQLPVSRDVERNEADKASLNEKSRDVDGEIDYEKMERQAIGVTRIETLWRHFGTNRPVLTALGLSIFLVCCAFTFDSSTTGAYEVFAVSYFKDHARLLGVINTVEAILNAVSKPFIAKLADMTSRQTAYCFLLVLYIVGYVVIASAQNGIALAVGRVISTVGQAGLDLVTDIIVADLTPLEWRGLFTAFTSMPFIWFAWIGPEISGPIIRNSNTGWRWGFGMFAIIVPCCVLPAAILLFWADWKARKHGEMRVAESLFERRWREQHPESPVPGKWNVFVHWCEEMDVIGLFLLGWAWALLLLPFSLAPAAKGRWSNPSMIAMLAVGAFLLIAFILWEWKFAPSPMLTRNLMYNRTFLLAVTIDIFYFMAGSLRSLWWSSYVYVVSDWSLENWNRYTNAETVGLCVFGIIIGALLRLTHRYKGIQITGLCIRIIGMGIVVYTATRVTVSTAAFAVIPVLIALGGACSVVGTRVASQASVPHHDLGQVIAQLALWTRIGGAVGSAIASTVWQSNMQDNMRVEGVPTADIAGIYGSIRTARAKYPWGSDNHQAVVRAYNNTVRPLFIAGLCITVIPLICGILMPNYYLGKSHNKVERNDVAGRRIGGDGPVTHAEQEEASEGSPGRRSVWQKLKANLY